MQKEIQSIQKQISSIESKIDSKKNERHNILRQCRVRRFFMLNYNSFKYPRTNIIYVTNIIKAKVGLIVSPLFTFKVLQRIWRARGGFLFRKSGQGKGLVIVMSVHLVFRTSFFFY